MKNKKRIFKLLPMTLILIMLLPLPSSIASEQMYYYEKYTTGADYHKVDHRVVRYIGPQYEDDSKHHLMSNHTSSFQQQKKILDGDFEYYSHYALDRNTGYYGLGEKIVRKKGQSPVVGYYFFVDVKVENGWASANKILQDSYIHEGQKGTYIETVKGSIGAYPINGKHTDGYWYVRLGLANTPTILSIRKPLKDIFKSGEQIILEGTVTDIDQNQSIKLTSNIGGVEVNWLKPSPLNEVNWRLVWNSDNIKEGKYKNTRVTATDGVGGSVSNYHTGDIIIDRTPPNLLIDRTP